MPEKLDPLSPEGRRVLNEIQGIPESFPYQPKIPSELGWEPKVDFKHLQSLGHVAGNPFYKDEQPDDAA
jgi:hypothetical protein